MATYVITSWKATPAPHDSAGTYVKLVGRAGGLISWLLAQVGIDPVVSITVLQDKILFEQGSLSGSMKRVIPISNVCSSYYGYSKPLKEAVILGIVCGMLTFWLFFLGALIGVAYYFLNKTMSLGIVELSGVVSGIEFKRSLIEGVHVDEPEARAVCDIIESLLDRPNTGSFVTTLAQSPQVLCANCGKAHSPDTKGQYCDACGGKVL